MTKFKVQINDLGSNASKEFLSIGILDLIWHLDFEIGV